MLTHVLYHAKKSNAGPLRGPGPYMDNYLHIDLHTHARKGYVRMSISREAKNRPCGCTRVHHDTGNPLWVTQEEHRDPGDLNMT